jgi:glycosyltransferase involved in cell wall biosynthesis
VRQSRRIARDQSRGQCTTSTPTTRPSRARPAGAAGAHACADSVIVHCEHGRDQLRRHFFREHAVFTIPHGNFIEPYPNTLTRREARARLGIEEDKFVYLFFGTIRTNKGVENLIEAFGGLPDPDAVLLLAARVYNDYGDTIVDRARHADLRISVLRSTFYQNDEFQLFYNAADIAVFPFTDILTSGSAITALSLGCPVIVPAIGCLPELMDERIGLTYDSADPAGLGEALARARQIDLAPCRVAARCHAKAS